MDKIITYFFTNLIRCAASKRIVAIYTTNEINYLKACIFNVGPYTKFLKKSSSLMQLLCNQSKILPIWLNMKWIWKDMWRSLRYTFAMNYKMLSNMVQKCNIICFFPQKVQYYLFFLKNEICTAFSHNKFTLLTSFQKFFII